MFFFYVLVLRSLDSLQLRNSVRRKLPKKGDKFDKSQKHALNFNVTHKIDLLKM